MCVCVYGWQCDEDKFINARELGEVYNMKWVCVRRNGKLKIINIVLAGAALLYAGEYKVSLTQCDKARIHPLRAAQAYRIHTMNVCGMCVVCMSSEDTG